MSNNIYHINSEIGKLKKVLVHEPGEELNNLVPKYLKDLLFDDIPWLPLAKKEHQAFCDLFRSNGVEVVYLTDLVSEALSTSLKVKEEFINEFISEANIYSETLRKLTKKYLMAIADTKELVKKTISGIKKSEISNYKKRTLSDFSIEYPFVTDPLPNLYFTRDPFVVIGDGISLNKMSSVTRNRETIYGKYIFKYHPIYKNNRLFYDRTYPSSIEGGDIMILSNEVLIVGISERTHPASIEHLAKNLFYKQKTNYKKVLAFTIPKFRTFMHLDTVFTQVDYYKFTVHEDVYRNLIIYELTRDEKHPNKLKVKQLDQKLEVILEKELHHKITLIPCGGIDSVTADREQWSDGSNCIAIAPGKVITYNRNEETNKTLEKNGIEVFTMPSSELSRGRGGPRCMSMPLEREDL